MYINNKKTDFHYEYNFPQTGIYEIKFKFKSLFESRDCMFKEFGSLISVDLSHFNSNRIIYMNNMFDDCTNLKLVDFTNFNT